MREKGHEQVGEWNQCRKESIVVNRERKTETTNGNNGKIVCNKMYFTVPRTASWATLRGPRQRGRLLGSRNHMCFKLRYVDEYLYMLC